MYTSQSTRRSDEWKRPDRFPTITKPALQNVDSHPLYRLSREKPSRKAHCTLLYRETRNFLSTQLESIFRIQT